MTIQQGLQYCLFKNTFCFTDVFWLTFSSLWHLLSNTQSQSGVVTVPFSWIYRKHLALTSVLYTPWVSLFVSVRTAARQKNVYTAISLLLCSQSFTSVASKQCVASMKSTVRDTVTITVHMFLLSQKIYISVHPFFTWHLFIHGRH